MEDWNLKKLKNPIVEELLHTLLKEDGKMVLQLALVVLNGFLYVWFGETVSQSVVEFKK